MMECAAQRLALEEMAQLWEPDRIQPLRVR